MAAEATSHSLVVVSAGLGQPSSTRLLADRLASTTEGALHDRGVPVERRSVELRDHAVDLANHLLTGFPVAELAATIDAVVAADGIIAVTPIYNASYAGLFKLFWDLIEHDALAGVPVLLGATGGTPRHSLALEHALRPLFSYLAAPTMPTAVFAAAEDWGRAERPEAEGLPARIERAAGELAAAMAGERRARRADPFTDPVPFEELLRGGGPTRP
jgi:FMN reductase